MRFTYYGVVMIWCGASCGWDVSRGAWGWAAVMALATIVCPMLMTADGIMTVLRDIESVLESEQRRSR